MQALQYIHRETPTRFRVDTGLVKGMRVPAYFYVNKGLEGLMFDELKMASERKVGGFLPAVQQLANVAALPGESAPHESPPWVWMAPWVWMGAIHTQRPPLSLSRDCGATLGTPLLSSPLRSPRTPNTRPPPAPDVGIVRGSFGMPDIHSGYGFAIGNVAAFDMENPEVCVCKRTARPPFS